MWENSNINFNLIVFLNLYYYVGNFITLSMYSRYYYRMFWRDNIVFIYRYLKDQVNYLNETLIAHLPVVPITG
jgi:hypothetical protein